MQISLNYCRVVDTLLHQPLVVPATTNDQMETRLYKRQKWLAFLVDFLLKLFRICDRRSV